MGQGELTFMEHLVGALQKPFTSLLRQPLCEAQVSQLRLEEVT